MQGSWGSCFISGEGRGETAGNTPRARGKGARARGNENPGDGGAGKSQKALGEVKTIGMVTVTQIWHTAWYYTIDFL